MAASAPSALWAAGGELLAHRLVHRVDRLQRSDHHLEAVDSIFGIPIDDVYPIHRQTSESALHPQYSRLLTEPAADIAELGAIQHLQRRGQVSPGDCGANLRRMHDGRIEYYGV